MKNIALIGCTGSIGRQAIKVAARYPDKFRIVAMAANTGGEVFVRQAAEVRPAFAALRQEGEAVPVPAGTRFARGESAFEEACSYADADVVLVAVTGFAGLKAALLAIGAGKDVALANKESLVAGGDLVMRLAAEKGVNVLPVDSEHSAVWQCLHFDRKAPFSRILLTASGGALRDVPLAELSSVTAAQALAHPNWDMGAKITIDCATMLNKGFEVIEAMHLYGAALSQIKVLIHRESVVHSLVEFADGAALAQLGVPSMELPIQLALTYPERLPCVKQLDLVSLGALHFYPLPKEKFPCYSLALAAGKAGGTAPTVLNAAAEAAVHAFLKEDISFPRIAETIEAALSAFAREDVTSFEQLKEADARARSFARNFIYD